MARSWACRMSRCDASAGSARRKFGGVDRSADVASPVVGHHEVVEHPHRDFMRLPGPHELRRGIGLYSPAASEGIQ